MGRIIRDIRPLIIALLVALGGSDRQQMIGLNFGERAKAKRIRVGYKALAWDKHVSDHRDASEIVRRANHDHIGLIVVSFHTLTRKINLDSIHSISGDEVFFVQPAEAPLIDMDLPCWSHHFRKMKPRRWTWATS